MNVFPLKYSMAAVLAVAAAKKLDSVYDVHTFRAQAFRAKVEEVLAEACLKHSFRPPDWSQLQPLFRELEGANQLRLQRETGTLVINKGCYKLAERVVDEDRGKWYHQLCVDLLYDPIW